MQIGRKEGFPPTNVAFKGSCSAILLPVKTTSTRHPRNVTLFSEDVIFLLFSFYLYRHDIYINRYYYFFMCVINKCVLNSTSDVFGHNEIENLCGSGYVCNVA